MRAVIQRVSAASCTVNGEMTGSIENGLLILLGVEAEDNHSDIEWLSAKISNMRIFSDEEGKMNLNIKQVGGEFMVISQFTLHASTRKGNRPSFIKAAKPAYASQLYEQFMEVLGMTSGLEVKKGVFGAHMQIQLLNDGPVTILIDSKNRE